MEELEEVWNKLKLNEGEQQEICIQEDKWEGLKEK